MKIKLTVLIIIFLSLLACSTKGNNCQSTKEIFETGAAYHHQKSMALTLLRYISIIENIENSKTQKTREDIDHWIDLGIIELSFQDDENVRRELPLELQNEINKLKQDLMTLQPETPSKELIYRKIAKYRKEHSRIHSVPLDTNQINLIDKFIKKYGD